MTGIEIATLVIGIILLVLAVALIALVLMQQGKDKKLSGAIAGGSNSYLGNSNVSDKDKLLFKITAVLAIVLVVAVLALYVII